MTAYPTPATPSLTDELLAGTSPATPATSAVPAVTGPVDGSFDPQLHGASSAELLSNIAALRASMRGTVLTSADGAAYDEARAAFNALVDQRPLVIAIPESAAEVATVVRFAKLGGHRVAVQATGHGLGRPADGAVLIVMTAMTEVTIDPVARTAKVQAGAKWGRVLGPAQEHGLAPLLGSTTDVGAVGYVLGGGIGWLARRYGLGADSVRSFDLVTPEGVQVHCSATERQELFWALRGGGAGLFGVVTEMEIELYPVETVYAGNLLYPVEMAKEVFARWRTWVAGVGHELTSSVLVMNFPPFEEVPEPIRGKSFVIVRGCWCGDLDAGAALIDEWRSWRQPALDMWGPMPFSMADAISNDPVDPLPARVTTEWFDTLPDEAIDVVVDATVPAPGAPPAIVFSEIRHAGGAVRLRSGGTVNQRGRSGEFLLEVVSFVPDPALEGMIGEHQEGLRHALRPYVTGAAYLNFLEGEDRRVRSSTAFTPASLARARALKQQLDAEDRFAHGLGLGS